MALYGNDDGTNLLDDANSVDFHIVDVAANQILGYLGVDDEDQSDASFVFPFQIESVILNNSDAMQHFR